MKYSLFIITVIFSLAFAKAQSTSTKDYIKEHYTKSIHKIEMRDGVKLYTHVYSPKDTSKEYPMMMQRTCYSVRPYGENEYPSRLGPNPMMMKDGYIFVYQDVRGRWMSEGDFDNMRPNIPGNNPKDKTAIDESSDTYDTIEYLLKNIPNNNGKVGQWGISYPGFYTAAALPDAHPALVASSPQAPIGDFFFDDFHHMGATLQSYLMAYPVFGHQTEKPTTKSWYNDKWDAMRKAGNMNDTYAFNMAIGPLKNVTENIYPDNFFWKDVAEHPNYDEFWQKRAIINHYQDVDHAVMTVGGWFDAEDLYGPLNIYKNIERNNKKNKNTIVMGPWSHGNWARERGKQMVNHIHFGDSISTFYQREIETPFFEHYLKGKKNPQLPEAYMFDTGLKQWEKFMQWPPEQDEKVFSFGKNGELLINEASDQNATFSYISDPMKPVPFRSEVTPVTFTPRAYMTDDQRHASRRPDVLTFQTEILEENLTLAGIINANLEVILNGITDADFIVKVIDVYPDDMKNEEHTPDHVTLAGYQQLVRAETFRGRFRNDFSKPEPFQEGTKTQVNFPLQDVLHTFKKGHRVMIQIHSTWFPYIDRNPQKYVDNIFEADEEDFTAGKVTITGASTVTVGDPNSINLPIPKLGE